MMSCKMNSNREYIHGYCSPCKRFFNSFFLSPLSNCNKLTWQGRRISKRHRHRHHQTPQPSTEKYPKINRNSKINSTQNQQKPKNQPNSKSIKNHRETKPKNSTHPPENPDQRSRIYRLICCHCCPRVFHCCQIFHCYRRLEVGGEGSVVEEREWAKAKEADSIGGWGRGGGELGVSWIGWVGELGVSEGRREKGDWAEREKMVTLLKWEKRVRNERKTVLITNNKKIINNII